MKCVFLTKFNRTARLLCAHTGKYKKVLYTIESNKPGEIIHELPPQ